MLVKIQGDSIFMEYVIIGLTAIDCVFLLSYLSCVWLCATLWTLVARLFCPRDSPAMNTGVGCYALLQDIFPTQRSNLCLLCLLHWQAGSLPLLPPGKPWCKDPQTWWLKPQKFISRSFGDKVTSMVRFWRGYSSDLPPSCCVPAWQRRRALMSLPFLLRAVIHSEGPTLMTSSKPNQLPGSPSVNAITLRIPASAQELGRMQFSLQQTWSWISDCAIWNPKGTTVEMQGYGSDLLGLMLPSLF